VRMLLISTTTGFEKPSASSFSLQKTPHFSELKAVFVPSLSW
jgi:hypothetical protein